VEIIYEHIEKLLGLNDYVIVPGLGGFILQQQPALITGNQIIAPRKIISFNALMQHSDGLLIIEIARSKGLSFRLAQELLQSKTDIFKQQLFTNSSYTFGNLGTFYIDDVKRISFVPNANASFIPSNFGLTDFALPDNSAKRIDFAPKSSQKHSIKNTLRYAAMFALVFASALLTERNPITYDNQSAALVDLNLLNSQAKIQRDTLNKVDTTRQIINKSADLQDIDAASENEPYHVIVASMPTLKMAEAYCAEVQKYNLPNARVLEPTKTYRVAVKSFTDRDEAIRFMEQLRTTDERFATAWVLCQK